LKDPRAAGSLDQAPVQVQITTAGVNDALIVPVDALVAESGGRYAVETVDARGVHHLVPVTVGLFDDADGLVQVTSPSLTAGERVVVPST
jgi:multidrug efflux pump subunit AcrA (membrane-fusion protein)